jgi:hypothetical protein
MPMDDGTPSAFMLMRERTLPSCAKLTVAPWGMSWKREKSNSWAVSAQD